MQHKIGYLFKVSLNVLQGILFMHDVVWGIALHEQHPIYTHQRSLQPQQWACNMQHKLAILSASDFFSKWQSFHNSWPKGDIITSSFEVVYKLGRQNFLSPFLTDTYTHAQTYTISVSVNLKFWTNLNWT